MTLESRQAQDIPVACRSHGEGREYGQAQVPLEDQVGIDEEGQEGEKKKRGGWRSGISMVIYGIRTYHSP